MNDHYAVWNSNDRKVIVLHHPVVFVVKWPVCKLCMQDLWCMWETKWYTMGLGSNPGHFYL